MYVPVDQKERETGGMLGVRALAWHALCWGPTHNTAKTDHGAGVVGPGSVYIIHVVVDISL